MDGDEQFDDIQTALQGTTVLKTPRVSRETIISVLQTHTNLIKSMKKDHSKLAFKVSDLEIASKDNNRKMNQLSEDVDAQKKSIVELFKLSDEFRKEMDELGEQVGELYLLKKNINEQQAFIENLSMRYNKFSTEVGEFMANVGASITSVEGSCRDTQFQLKELKDYVDHFADNLVLSSGQITVETDAGFTAKPVSLTETLRLARTTLTEIETGAEKTEEKIEQICTDLDSKAPDTVLFNVSTLERKVSTIEVHLRKEEEQGIGAIRKACEELSVTVQSMAMEMSEKIDRESVGFIVHEKYEEIVRYLQDALQSSLEDENRFKQKADEIQEMVILLTNSKADRTEIQHMQELMVKSEALLKKVGGQMNIKERLKDLVSRKELEGFLEMKVDKLDLEQQLQMVTASTKRNRKLSSFAAAGPGIVEDAIDAVKTNPALNRKPVVGGGGGNPYTNTGTVGHAGAASHPAGSNTQGMRRGGPESMQNEAMMMQQAAYGQYGGKDGYQSPFLPANNSDDDGDGNYDPNRTNVTNGGVGFTTEFPRINQNNGGGQQGYGGEAPVMAIGRSMGNTSPGRGGDPGAESGVLGKTKIGADFGSHVRTKKNPVTSSSLPNPVAPGQFRSATEAGKAGGGTASPERVRTPGGRTRNAAGSTAQASGTGSATNYQYSASGAVLAPNGAPVTQQQWVALGNEPNQYHAYVQHVAADPAVAAQLAASASFTGDPGSQQGSVPDHTSFMNGPVVGGGFNTHSKHLQHKMPGSKPVPDDDVEGKGLMIKGQDGHFYYQDLGPGAKQ